MESSQTTSRGQSLARRFLILLTLVLAVALAAVIVTAVRRQAAGGPVDELPDFTDDADVFRIYVLGGSTSKGVPYLPRADFGQIAAVMLGGAVRGRPIEVVNVAKEGKDAAYALQQARTIADKEPNPGSAAAFVYTGNNEFIEHDTGQDLSVVQRRLFDVPLVPPEERARIIDGYREDLHAIATTFHEAGIVTIFSTLAVNLADWEPNRSVLEDAAHEGRMRELLDAARAALDAGDARAALVELDAAVDLEPGFAYTWKLAGDARRSLRQFEAAHEAFQRAVDLSGNPDVVTTVRNDIVREVASELGVPLVDSKRLIRTAATDGLPGYDLFWDNCHPTLEGHALIAAGFAEILARELQLPKPRTKLGAGELEAELDLDEEFLARIWRKQGQYCYGSSVLTWNPAPRLARARVYLDRAFELRPEDPFVRCSMAILATLEGDMDRARVDWKRAHELDPVHAKSRAENPRVRELLRRRGIEDPLSLFDS